MSLKHLFVKVICISFFLASTSSSSDEDMARDFIEHVLRIPNPDKVLNSVLGRLERNKQQNLNRPRATDDSDCDDPSDMLPEYTESLQISRERDLRQLGTQNLTRLFGVMNRKALRECNKLSSFQFLPVEMFYIQHSEDLDQKHYPICHLERRIRKLNTNEYEYRPAYYEEIRCTMSTSEDIGVTNEICSSLGFSCVQWNKTIHLTRRRYTSDCWETRTMVIPAGCECMWSVHKLGDMKLHV